MPLWFLVPVAAKATQREATADPRDRWLPKAREGLTSLVPVQSYGPPYTPTAGSRSRLPQFDRRLSAGALAATGGKVSPILLGLTLSEAQIILGALQQIAEGEYRAGVPFVGPALHSGRLRYVKEPDGQELWLKPSLIWKFGGGDCDDYAAAVAAEWSVQGVPARAVLRPVRPGLVHALVQRISDGALFDPCITGGMLDGNVPQMRRVRGVS